MSSKHSSLAAAAAVALTAGAAGPASADSTIVADASAQNVTAYGTTAAWSRKAADGHHLVIANNGVVADAPVPVSPAPYDPDLGPTSGNGRTIVYARGGDLYRFDVGSTAETKLRSSSAANEIAPSFFKENLVFSRTNGRRPGTYIARPGRRVTRLFRTVALETDLAQTRVIGRYGKGLQGIIRILNYNADDVRIVARSSSHQIMLSPTLSRFNGFWLRTDPQRGLSDVQRVGVNAHRGLNVVDALRGFNALAGSLATDGANAVLYTTAAGVQAINPKLDYDRE